MCKVIGIDVSKATLDVAFVCDGSKWSSLQVSNDTKGFIAIAKYAGPDGTVVMEASGPYYLRLAMYLHAKGTRVCVENPLSIRRYSQMLLQRAKTDRKDARTIAEYGMVHTPEAWEPASDSSMQIRQAYSALELLQKQEHQTSRQLEAFESSGILNPPLRKAMTGMLKDIEKRKVVIEKMIDNLAETAYGEILKRLMSIPGIGRKTAVYLAALTDGFNRFEDYKQLTAYVGLSPRVFQSGTSVRGKGHICKMGSPQMRKLLYLCSWTAKSCNTSCAAMYQRLKAKGKPEKVIKVAIANKLLKQAFAIATGQNEYQKNFSHSPCF
jgi:transposase